MAGAIAQNVARRARADVRRWWWRHVAAFVVGVAGVFLITRPARQLGTLIWLAVPMLLVGAVTAVAQHVVLAIVILEGLRALRPADDELSGPSRLLPGPTHNETMGRVADSSRRWLRLGLIVAAFADLPWLLLPVAIVLYAFMLRADDGIGSVSAGISEPFLFALFAVPLVLHGVAQVLARRAKASVRRWWRGHVAAIGLVAPLFVLPPRLLDERVAAVMVIGLQLLLVGQHVALGVVILRGWRALRR